MVLHHIKVTHIPAGHNAYLNLNEEIIAIAPIVKGKSNVKLTQDVFDKAYPDCQCDVFKIDNALVYRILSKAFIGMNAYIYMKQKRSM